MVDREIIYDGNATTGQREITYPPEPIGGISGGSGSNEKRHEWSNPNDYLGYAVSGSSETDAVWTITLIVINADGTVASTTTLTNVKWSERTIIF